MKFTTMDHIRLQLVKFLQSLIHRITATDKSYQTLSQWRNVDYITAKEAEKEWYALEAKYGDWATAYDNEPSECSRLERILA